MYSGILVICPYKKAREKSNCKTLGIINLYYVAPMQIQSDNGSHFKGNEMKRYCVLNNIEWIYHIPYYPLMSGLIERMNGLLKEQLRKLSSINSYQHCKDNLITALLNLNNRPLGGSTPLARMMTPHLQIRKQQTHKIPNIEYRTVRADVPAPYPVTPRSARYDLHCLENFRLDRKEIRKISTGVCMRIPKKI